MHMNSFTKFMCFDAEIKENSELSERLKVYESGQNLPADTEFALQHFSYNNSGVLELVYKYLDNTSFSGITVNPCDYHSISVYT